MSCYYVICDCDNCFVSCEKVFRPDLEGRPVVVLSNNDGCVVARSPEAKELGISMGVPFYQLRRRFNENQVIAFSSNYELYADMTSRVMSLIRKSVPAFFRYSIDEAFCVMPSKPYDELKAWGENLSAWIMKLTGMPVSLGLARTKSLAKIAVHFAKKYPGYKHCCVIDSEEKRLKALSLVEIGDVWGIGRRIVKRLTAQNIFTALDFARKPHDWVSERYNIVTERTWRELNGEDCIPDETMAAKKSITVSRSFAEKVRDLPTLRTHVSNFASRCSEKLRGQNSVAAIVGVYIVTNRFNPNEPQYGNMLEYKLSTPSASTIDIVNAACRALAMIYKEGYVYKKAGVILMGISRGDSVQPDLFEYSPERASRHRRLDETVDRINRIQGRATVTLGGMHYGLPDTKSKADPYADIIRHDHRSPSPTTNWRDIIKLY